MSQLTKIEMRKRLEVIIQAAHSIQEKSLSDNFTPNSVLKEMQEIRQYSNSVQIDLDSLTHNNTLHGTGECPCDSPEEIKCMQCQDIDPKM